MHSLTVVQLSCRGYIYLHRVPSLLSTQPKQMLLLPSPLFLKRSKAGSEAPAESPSLQKISQPGGCQRLHPPQLISSFLRRFWNLLSFILAAIMVLDKRSQLPPLPALLVEGVEWAPRPQELPLVCHRNCLTSHPTWQL